MTAEMEMPKYKCHKEVHALKIAALDTTDADDKRLLMHPVEEGYAPILLSDKFVEKHTPRVGGYYVIYKDGYESFSPADAFEDGYHLTSARFVRPGF